MIKQYRIADQNLKQLQHKLALLNKRAAKLGVRPLVLSIKGEENIPVYADAIDDGNPRPILRYHRIWLAELDAEAPKFAGWSLAACVEHAEEGNILRKAPGFEGELNEYREGAQRCDHCHCIRNRSETFIVVHDDGARKMGGRDCIKDFLGHADPHQLASWAELIFSAVELCAGSEDGDFFGCGGHEKEYLNVEGWLALCAAAIRAKGYVSSKAEYESQGSIQSTKSLAAIALHPGRDDKAGRDYFLAEDIDRERAAVARQYVLDRLSAKPAAELSDFEHNMLVVCKCEVVDPKSYGIAAYVPAYYAREVERDIQHAARAPQAYFGEVGKRYKKQRLVYLKSTGFESQFGYQYIHSFQGVGENAGVRFIWKSGCNVDYAAGQELEGDFTIKAHDEYKGNKQTKISRLNERAVAVPAAQPVAEAA